MEEKNRKKQKLTEALEDLRMEFIEEAVQPDVQASYGAKVPKSHPVLRWVLIAAAAVLLVGVMFTASILGNIAWKRSHPAGTAENPSGTVTASPDDPPEGPEIDDATLEYISNGDGTCYVSGILNPSGAKTLRVTVPPTHNGETVTAYRPENLIFPLFYICEKDEFEHWLDVFAAAINQISRENGWKELDWRDYAEPAKRNLPGADSGNDNWFYFEYYLCFYQLQDNVYVLDERNPQYEIEKLAGFRQEYLPSLPVRDILKQERINGYPHGENCVVRTQIVSVTLPETVTAIGEKQIWEEKSIDVIGTLRGTSISEFNIPSGVQNIIESTFSGCSGLTDITIPDTVRGIEADAFRGCTGLATVTYQGTVEQWKSMAKAENWNETTGDYTVVCTDGTLTKDQS